MNILIIEDEYSLADAIAETLKKEKFNINIQTNGEDGENEALTGNYDLILLDVMLPRKNGFEILTNLRNSAILAKDGANLNIKNGTDRGGGIVTVDGGTYTTTGQGSPTIYSTANITVNNSDLIAKASEGIVIEGKNSVTINNCNLTDRNTKLNGKSTTYKNIFLYQSMSGDAANGNSEFTAKNSNIVTNNGDTFYVTNTTSTINLSNNTIVNNDNTGNFLRAQKDSWGKSESNGGDVTLLMDNQKASGNIVIDSISTLDMTMKI